MSSLCPSPISQPGFSIWRTVPVMWLLLGAWHVTAVAAPEPMHLGPCRCSFELYKLPKCSKAWLDSGWTSGEGSCCCCLADRHEASGYPLHCCCRHRPSRNASTCTPVLLLVFLFGYRFWRGLCFSQPHVVCTSQVDIQGERGRICRKSCSATFWLSWLWLSLFGLRRNVLFCIIYSVCTTSPEFLKCSFLLHLLCQLPECFVLRMLFLSPVKALHQLTCDLF